MKKIKYNKKDVEEFLWESNAIEGEYSEQAFEDALKAWNYLKDKSFLTPEVILGAHNFLQKNLRPDIAGFWRNVDVWIGGHKKHFVSVQLIEEQIKEWIKDVETTLSIPKDQEENIKRDHITFEEIHGFEDGNGRVGRLLYNWERMMVGLPIHIIHAGEEQDEYYEWFRK